MLPRGTWRGGSSRLPPALLRWTAALGIATSALAPAAARADDDPPEAPAAAEGYSLRRCLELADRNHPNIQAAQARLAMMRGQLDEAHSAPFSNFTLTAGVGPAPTFRGSNIYTQDREVGLTSSIGMAWRVNLDGTVPLWTFGKITNTWRAAEAQIKVGEGDVKKQRAQVRLDVRKAYYGLQLSRDSLALLTEAADKLDRALASLEKRVADGDADDIDLLRLKTARFEIEGRTAEAQKFERIALAALRFLTGVEHGFDIPARPIRPPKHAVKALPSYLDAARLHRPELQMARAGVVARSAQVDLARSRMMPDIGLTLSAGYSRAPEIADQLNPFVRDDANFFRYGFGVGMRWTLDFVPGTARLRQAEGQLEENKQILRYALGGIGVEVETAYAQVQEAKRKFDAYSQASRLARQWMIRVAQGIDVGTIDEKDLVEPARQYALQRFNYLQATLDLNMAMAALALATGWDDLADTAE